MTPSDPHNTGPILPGAWLGVFGGGQLGRMFAHAAQRMGYHVAVFSPEDDGPAGQAADRHFHAEFEDSNAVAEFAHLVAAVTLEFENVPASAVAEAEKWAPVRPSGAVLHTSQHRVREKTALAANGVPCPKFAAVESRGDLRRGVELLGLPAVLKTSEFGYDGKGQRILRSPDELDAAYSGLGEAPCILEEFVDFRRELSVIVARSPGGDTATCGPIENRHENHILDISLLPAPETSAPLAAQAEKIAHRVAEVLGVEGLVCVELFETLSGALLVNEIAPRPHNSGHLTIEACRCSQFEQQVRAMCGLPLGDMRPERPAAMANLLGEAWSKGTPRWDRALSMPGVRLHLYGKSEPREGRKMGHLTATAATVEEAQRLATDARRALSSD